MSDTLPITPKLKRRSLPAGLLRRKRAARFLDLGLSTFDRHDAAGLIPQAIRIGGCKAWNRRELIAWIGEGCPDRATWTPLWDALRRQQTRTRNH